MDIMAYAGVILFLTLILTFANRRFLHNRICPICAASVSVWAFSLIGLWAGIWRPDPLVLAILIGASLGASVEKYGKVKGGIWKSAVFIFGLPTVYLTILENYLLAAVFGAVFALTAFFAGKKIEAGNNQGMEKIRIDKFKDCC
jgi:hypothetical protein